MAVNYVKFYRGSNLAFENAVKNADTLYFITDSNSNKSALYLGDKLIASNITELTDLEDILISEGLNNNDILVYSENEQKWVNKTIIEAIGLMDGATSDSQGSAGLVPAPGIGQENYFLRGDGTWALPEGTGTVVSETQVFEATATDFSYEKQMEALDAVTGDKDLAIGDIGIVKVLIATGKYQYTAYVFNGSAWAAMDGNYSSDSIYFDENLTVTTPIGTVTQEMINEGGGFTTLESANKNMTQVLASLLAEEKDPSVDKPSATYSVSGGSGEVGTTFTLPTATFKITDVGSYTYGSKDSADVKYGATDTGVVFKAGDIVLTQGDNTKSNTSDLTTDGILSLTATGDNTYGDNAVKFTFKATAYYTESADRIPVTNLGNKNSDLKILSDNLTINDQVATFSGYRNSFYGSNVTPVEINSANIRQLTGKSKSTTNSLSVTIAEGAKQVIIAVKDGRKVTKVADEGAFGTDIFSEFNLVEGVQVEGANGYASIAYNVYVYSPSTALGANTYTVTVANE